MLSWNTRDVIGRWKMIKVHERVKHLEYSLEIVDKGGPFPLLIKRDFAAVP